MSPGIFTLGGGSNVLTALNVAGGIAENGSYRKIEHKRGGETIQVIDQMMDIASKFPDIPSNIRQDDIDIKLEFNKSKKFIKRISIDSNRAKLSLYLKNCNLNKPINNLFFSENPVFRYQ